MDRRYNSIDILRALAIIEMITGHIYMLMTNQNYWIIGFLFVLLFGTWAEAIFLGCAGTGFFLYINKRIKNDWSKRKIFIEILKRAAFLFFITLIILLSFGFIFDMHISFIIYWSIFQVIAFSMLLFFFIPFFKKIYRRIIIITLIFTIYFGYVIIKYNNIEILFILVSGGAFTYLPWASFYLIGILIGDLILNTEIEVFKKILTMPLLSGIILLVLSLFWLNNNTFNIDNLIILHITAYAGYFILFSLIFFLTDVKEIKSPLQVSLVRWGKVSFSLYYIHFIVIIAGLIIAPLIISNFTTKGLQIYQYFIFVAITILIIEIFSRIWEKYDFIFGIEWIMNLISKRSPINKQINEEG